MNRPVAVTEIHVLAFAGSHCSAFAASDHSPHKLTSEESSCPTELYRARKLLFAVIAFDKTDWFRHRQALSIDMSHLRLSYSDVLGGEAAAYVGQRPILRQQASDRPCRRHSVADAAASSECRSHLLPRRRADLGDDMTRVVVATLLVARLLGKARDQTRLIRFLLKFERHVTGVNDQAVNFDHPG